MVTLLLGAEQVNVDVTDSQGQTPFYWASRTGHKGMAKLLIRTGQVNIDVRYGEGQTPLSFAARAWAHRNSEAAG